MAGQKTDVPASVPGMPVARLNGVVKRYNEFTAIDNVSFDVTRGELLTLLGPSGCGKTTTMRAIAGLERLNGGEIYLEDHLVSAPQRRIHVPPERRDVGMVFQSYAIWPHMTVFENVAYPLRCRKVDKHEIRDRVLEKLRLVEMENYETRMATQLSGGQQQRVALARSMAMQPTVMLLDEPLCNLDAKLRAQMRSHIKELQLRTGLTMIYVTHDQTEAMALSDRVIVMNRGVIEQVGTPEEIYKRPQSEFVADFVGAINFIKGRVTDIDADHRIVSISTGLETILYSSEVTRHLQLGEQVLVMIRPEKIRVRASTRSVGEDNLLDEANTLRGKVVLNTYCGDHRELQIDCRDFSLKAMSDDTVWVERGAFIEVSFSPTDLHLLPR